MSEADRSDMKSASGELNRRHLLKYLAAASAGFYAINGLAGSNSERIPHGDSRAMSIGENELPDWGELVDLLKPAGKLNDITVAPGDDQLRMELYRQFIMNLTLGYFMYFQLDPEFPDWMPFLNSVFLLQPNPDDVYHIVKVDDDGVYRVQGNRGSVRILLFSLGYEIMGTTDRVGGGLGQLDAEDLHIAADGSFEFILSAQKPEGYRGDWWKMPKGAKSLLSRQRSYDWRGEQSASLAIERLDTPPGTFKPRMPAAEIAANLREVLGGYPERLSRIWLSYQNQALAKMKANSFEITDFNGALPLQAYLQGNYQYAPDQAIVLETAVPSPCRYWNFQVADSLWNAVEVLYRQSSLNGHQAKLDSDGRFRAVISLTDPGVPNWLDSGGFTKGMLIGRWFGAKSFPQPEMKVVKLADLRAHLPADTPVVTPEARKQMLSQRIVGGQLRRRW